MGKPSEGITIFPNEKTEPDDDSWIAELVNRFGGEDAIADESENKVNGAMDDLPKEELFADQYEAAVAARSRKPSKGRTKPNTAAQNTRAEQLSVEQIIESRKRNNEKAVQTLQTQLAGSGLLKLVENKDPDASSFVETYAHWVVDSIVKNNGAPVLEHGDISIEDPEGAVHIWSGIGVEVNNPSNEQSVKEAKEKLETKLKENIATWEEFLGTAAVEIKPNEGIWDARERAIRTQVYKMARTP